MVEIGALAFLLALGLLQAALFFLQCPQRRLLSIAVLVQPRTFLLLRTEQGGLLFPTTFLFVDLRLEGDLGRNDLVRLLSAVLGQLVQIAAALVGLGEALGGEEITKSIVGAAVAINVLKHSSVFFLKLHQVVAERAHHRLVLGDALFHLVDLTTQCGDQLLPGTQLFVQEDQLLLGAFLLPLRLLEKCVGGADLLVQGIPLLLQRLAVLRRTGKDHQQRQSDSASALTPSERTSRGP